MNPHRFVMGCVLVAILFAPRSLAIVQQQGQLPALEAPGFQAKRDYFSELSFEHIDMLSGGLVLSFTDLVLPTNAGRELRFLRTYSSKGGGWKFGIAGVALRISDPPRPTVETPAFQQLTPALHMADGGIRQMAWLDSPNINDPDSFDNTISRDFWILNRDTGVLRIPNGDTCQYVPDPNDAGMLLVDYCLDAFNNQVDFGWTLTGASPELQVTVAPGTSSERLVRIMLSGTSSLSYPSSMIFAGNTWEYSETTVTLPAGGSWTFGYTGPDLTSVTTPHGGVISYVYDDLPFEGPLSPGTQYQTRVITDRTTSGPNIAGGAWQYDYQITGSGISGESSVVTPAGHRTVYNYGWNESQQAVFDEESGLLVLRERTVQRPDGQGGWIDLEHEELAYQLITVLGWWTFGTLEVDTRTVTRFDEDGTNGQAYVTDFDYDLQLSPIADYHRPTTITETGTAGERVTERSYVHYTGLNYMVGLPATEDVTVGSETFSKSWEYDPANGFKTAESIYGLETTFVKGSYGNVATVTSPSGRTTTFQSYKYGQPRILRTPMYEISRSINPDGTIALETRAGRTATYQYDQIGRPRIKQPPGETNPTEIVYDDAARQVTATRGSSVVTTTLDGFGRAIQTSNSLGVITNNTYDAEGRVILQGYPFKPGAPSGGNDIGTTIQYDALGRVTSRTNPAVAPALPTTSTRVYYGDGRVIVTDEENRQTELGTHAFGNPDESHLARTIDAHQLQWEYTYNALGRLKGVLASDGKQRSWVYNDQNLLESETHPESGTTLFTYLNGLLQTKTDAEGLQTAYTYDDNDRVIGMQAGTQQTTFAYEVNSDNRVAATTTNPSTGVVWRFDPFTGRLQFRQDLLGGKTFTTLFEYDHNDNITALIYPSGRRVQYNVNAEGQPAKVYEPAAGRDYADAISYHPSGGLAAYTAGNGLVTTITYDASRYWIRTTDVGTMHLEYNAYDGVGNPHAITDSRGPSYGQAFAYDALDRLTDAAGPYGAAHYDYDLHGNRNNPNYTIDQLTLRLTSDGTSTFTYDDNGNMLAAGSDTFTYTAQNQVATSFHDSVTTTYAYDADQQRVTKSANGSTTYYIHGPQGELLTEWKDPGTANGRVRDYIYLGSRLISAVAKNTADDPAGYSVPLTPTHRFATSWQVPNGNGDNVMISSGASSAARKSYHPDMPSTGLRLGVQNAGHVSYMANGPLFIGSNSGSPKQGGVFLEFDIERLPFSNNGEWLATDGGGYLSSSTDDLRLYITPGGSLVVHNHGGRATPLTLYTSPPLELHTPHTLELRFEYNSYEGPYATPNPVWENLTSRAQVFLDGALVATYGASAGGSWNSSESSPTGLDLRNGTGWLVSTKLKSPGPDNGLLMNVFRGGITSAQSHGDTLNPYGNTWRTTLLQVAGPGTYSEWTGGQPDWRARTAIHGSVGSFNAVITTAANQKVSYLMESMASRGITGNIGVVMVGIRNSYASAGSQAFIRRNGVETMLPDFALPSSPNLGMRWYRVSEGGWSPSDTIEVGLMTGASGTSYLTSVAVMVEHNTPEPAPLTETSARVITVNYTGNGTGQTIDFGVDMLPTALLVMPATGAAGVEPLIWWESRQGAGSFSESGVTFGRVWPQKGRFQVVHPTTGNSYNSNGVNYVAIALFDPASRYVIPFGVSKPASEDNYTHYLRYQQSGELADNFTPDFMFGGFTTNNASDSVRANIYRGPGHTGDLTGKLGVAHASDADRIQSFTEGQVQFGASIGSPTQGDASFWAGRVSDGVSTDRLMAVTSYIGDGTASRNITLELNGQSPAFALVVPTTAVAKVYRVSTDTTGRQSWSGNAVANSITAMGSNQITVGTAMNTIGVTYDVWAIRPGLVEPW